MPELPEVEVLMQQIKPFLLGKIFNNVLVRNNSLRQKVPENISSQLEGEIILKIFRRNKYLILETKNQWLVIHLGMTGQIFLNDNSLPQKHDHIMINFNAGNMRYRDPRRFGLFLTFSKEKIKNYQNIPLFKKLGAEPLQTDFKIEEFKNIVKKSSAKQNIKAFLMDGSKVCGIGNIYASEILFQAKIHPEFLISKLSDKKIKSLHKIIIITLKKAVDSGGSSISDYRHADGGKGHTQELHLVYGKYGQPCVVCKTSIERFFQNGRSSYYCPRCQKL